VNARALGLAAARRKGNAVRARLARVNAEPVIVLGKEKSGTTAIAALLAQHTGSTVTLDIPALFGKRMGAIRSGRTDLAELVRRNRLDFSRGIIKQPSMTWIYPQVRTVFSQARYLMIVRDPRDNIRSVLNRLDLPGDLDDLDEERFARLPAAWSWHFESPGILGLRGGNYIELAAERWNLAADTYLNHRDEMLLIRYEDFLVNKAGCIKRCAEALGLEARNDISAAVDTQYQPRGMRDCHLPEFFGERNLRTIERSCARRMKELGYRPTEPVAR